MSAASDTSGTRAIEALPFRQRLSAGIVLVLLFVACLAGLSLYQSARVQEQRAFAQTENLARLLELDVADSLDKVDVALRTIVHAADQQLTRGELDRPRLVEMLSFQQSILPGHFNLRIADADGRPFGPDLGAGALSIADRDLFTQARNAGSDDRMFTGPVRSRIDGRWIVVMGRRLARPDGTFAGLVYAVIDVDYFTALFERLNLGTRGAVSLRTIDLVLVARYPGKAATPSPIGSSNVSAQLRDVMASKPMEGSYLAPTAIDGISRANSYRRIMGYPLLVIVGLATDDYLGAWRSDAIELVVLTVLLVVVIGGEGWVIYRAWAMQRADAVMLSRQTDRYQMLLHNASDGIYVVDMQGRLLEVSDAACSMSGYTRDELLRMNIRDIDVHWNADDLHRKIAEFSVAPATIETQHRRKDGSVIDIELSARPIELDGERRLYCAAREISARKQMERALAASEATLSAIFEASPVGIVVTRASDGMLIRVNETFAEISGYSRAELLGRTSAELGLWVDALAREDFQSRTYQQGRAMHIEMQGRRKSGEIRNVILASEPIELTGEACALSVVTDITERRSLEERQRLLSHAVGQANASIVMTDLQGAIVFVNDAFTRTTGYARDEVIGRNPRILQSGSVPRELYAELWSTITAGKTWRGEMHNKKKNGELYWETATISPVTDESGRITHFIAVKDDTTQRKEDENRLRRVNRLYAVLSGIDEAIARERDINTLFAEACRVTVEIGEVRMAWIGLADWSLGHIVPVASAGADREYVDNARISLTDSTHSRGPTGSAVRLGTVQVCADIATDPRMAPWRERALATGFRASVSLPLKVHDEPRGALTLYAAVPDYFDAEELTLLERLAADIGFAMEAAEARADLERHRQHLEDLVKQRTAELEAARAEAVRLAEAKSEFLAHMSHEIRTPLNGVLGLAQIGYRDAPEPGARAAFGRILESGKLLLGVIDDILDFSKLDAGKLRIEQVATDVRQIIRTAIDLLAVRAAEKQIAITHDVADDVPTLIQCDPLRLSQVIVNLLSNAVKFTEVGSVHLMATRNGERLVLRIVDTGIGMTADQVARLFVPFEQGDKSTSRRFGGTGLGLAITKRLVDLMEGDIRAESRVGQGSVFEVRVPLVAVASAGAPVERAVQPPDGLPRLTDMSVLVAEDNEVNQFLLDEILQIEGARVTMVSDGAAAVERVRAAADDAFDVVLMDVQMPVMDGFEATRRIHAHRPALPVIGQTAHALAEERDRCAEAGMADLVTKPIDIDRLVNAILRWVRRPRHDASDTIALAEACQQARPDAAVVDWPALHARFGGDAAMIERIVAKMLATQRQVPEALRESARQADMAQIAVLAHDIKSISGSLSAQPLEDLSARTLEAARGQRDDALALALATADAMDRVFDELAAQGGAT